MQFQELRSTLRGNYIEIMRATNSKFLEQAQSFVNSINLVPQLVRVLAPLKVKKSRKNFENIMEKLQTNQDFPLQQMSDPERASFVLLLFDYFSDYDSFMICMKSRGWVDRSHTDQDIIDEVKIRLFQPFYDYVIKKLDEMQYSTEYFVGHEYSPEQIDDLRNAINAALEEKKLTPYYADQELRTGLESGYILQKIYDKISSTRFGIYDISNPEKPNVFIELGIAIGMGAEYYVVVKSGTQIPSNLAGLDRIEYKSFRNLTEQLKKLIES